MRGDMIWGTLSELAINGYMLAITGRLIRRFGEHRVSVAQMQGQKHAMLDDIFLHGAIMLQSYNKLNK
jgi:hypothetical protein